MVVWWGHTIHIGGSMKKTIAGLLFGSFVFILASCDLMGGGSGGGGGSQPEGSLVVSNDSSYTVSELYVSPVDSSSWGPNQLGDAAIAPGGVFTLSGIPAGDYDLLAEETAGGYWDRWDVTIPAGGEYAWRLLD